VINRKSKPKRDAKKSQRMKMLLSNTSNNIISKRRSRKISLDIFAVYLEYYKRHLHLSQKEIYRIARRKCYNNKNNNTEKYFSQTRLFDFFFSMAMLTPPKIGNIISSGENGDKSLPISML
jgi:hypothetical protein